MAIRLTRTRVAILVVALAAAGFGIWKWTQRGPKPVEVQTAVVQRADLQAKVTANGKIQAQRKVDISATIAGQITHLAVREGDRVTKGQFLLQIDPVSPRADRAQQRGLDAGAPARGGLGAGHPGPGAPRHRARGSELPGADHPGDGGAARAHRREPRRRRR